MRSIGYRIEPDPTKIEKIEDMMVKNGKFQLLPSSEIKPFVGPDFSCWCLLRGLYGIPTQDLILWLSEEMGDTKNAIEIGAGCGLFSEFLAMRATDSYIQDEPSVRFIYESMGQPPVKYGPNVEKIEALDAIKKYKPEVVFGSWVTHKYNEREHARGGFAYGVDEEALLAQKSVKKYIVLGNENTHKVKKIATHPPAGWSFAALALPFLISRAQYPELDRVYVWSKK